MRFDDPTAPTATTLQRAFASGATSAAALVQNALDRIARSEPALRAWQALDPALPLAQAAALDRAHAAGEAPGPLAGVPVGVKDLFDTADLPTTYGSPIHAQHRPAHDAVLVARLRAAGAIMMGKTVTTEFGYFTPGPTANPHDIGRTPGGSSSGSAAAVAAGMVPLALGTQTAGSLIRPASYCGVFALKPTHGVLPLEGVQGLAPSLDTPGWLARDADDLELLRAVFLGQPYEPLPLPASLRLASCCTHEWLSMASHGVAVWEAAHRRLAQQDLAPAPLALPAALAGLCQAQQTIMAAEAVVTLAQVRRTHAQHLSAPLRELLERGDAVQPADLQAATALAATGRSWAAEHLAELDALIVPAAPGEAPAGLRATGDPVFSRVWTLLGLPCVNVPGLRGPNGLPVGLQLVGARHQERRLLAAARRIHAVLREA